MFNYTFCVKNASILVAVIPVSAFTEVCFGTICKPRIIISRHVRAAMIMTMPNVSVINLMGHLGIVNTACGLRIIWGCWEY